VHKSTALVRVEIHFPVADDQALTHKVSLA
jgi:hypothetical protein